MIPWMTLTAIATVMATTDLSLLLTEVKVTTRLSAETSRERPYLAVTTYFRSWSITGRPTGSALSWPAMLVGLAVAMQAVPAMWSLRPLSTCER